MNDASRLNLQYLNYLVVLVAEGHVTRASDKVGISQPAMSAALARLRKLFNDPILVRTTTGMQPTPRALELADRAKIALELLRGGASPTGIFHPERAEGHIRMMASEGVAEVVTPGLMAIIRRRAPHLRFTIKSGDIRRSSEYLRDGELEFAMGFTKQKSDDLHEMLLYPQRIVCLVSRQHANIQGSLTLDQFSREGHVVWGADPVPHPALELLVDQALNAVGVSRKVIARVPSLAISAALVAQTDLLAAIPARMAKIPAITELCQVLPLPFLTEAFDVQLIWHERWHRDPTHAWVRKAFRQVAKELQTRYLLGSDLP